MTSKERIKKQKELVERGGWFYCQKGLQTSAARIIALLMVMDKELFTFDEIIEELKISKSAASHSLKLLLLINAIEYITIPGDRKRYFRIKTQDKFVLINEHEEKLKYTMEYIKSILELKADKNSNNSIYLANLIDMLQFFLDKFKELKEEYVKQKNL